MKRPICPFSAYRVQLVVLPLLRYPVYVVMFSGVLLRILSPHINPADFIRVRLLPLKRVLDCLCWLLDFVGFKIGILRALSLGAIKLLGGYEPTLFLTMFQVIVSCFFYASLFEFPLWLGDLSFFFLWCLALV